VSGVPATYSNHSRGIQAYFPLLIFIGVEDDTAIWKGLGDVHGDYAARAEVACAAWVAGEGPSLPACCGRKNEKNTEFSWFLCQEENNNLRVLSGAATNVTNGWLHPTLPANAWLNKTTPANDGLVATQMVRAAMMINFILELGW
jgi:hypothetical protein